ncbi:MAG TPA: clostripain-related cysteine peptidase [Pyrinomonadaceae bacterium]|jgi:hypothetical protein
MSNTNDTTDPGGWTLMFFFAGDNALAPIMVSELKALKDAGYQLDTTVLAHFDPNEPGAPTRVYNVNRARKERAAGSRIGDGKDPFVRNLNEDRVEPGALDEGAGVATARFKKGLAGSDKTDVREALTDFLGYCLESHRAAHYMLFLIGHGMIVGNDAFLPDDHVEGRDDAPGAPPVAALSLKQLEAILRPFGARARDGGGEFELLSMHSCSMSSAEVVYQLKGTARYMMATQGISFVGSWPYRQLLKKTFNAVEEARKAGDEVNVGELVNRLYDLSLHNSTDFLSAGYSADLCLCRLEAEKVEALKEPLQTLAEKLKLGLEDERGKEHILLAHWKAQSFWHETYTDLFDFCKCLDESCAAELKAKGEGESVEPQRAMRDACAGMMKAVSHLVKRTEAVGSKYQYSHGLSIYFPWSRPVGDVDRDILKRYEQEYAITTEMGEHTWLSFLNSYFDKTMRRSRSEEDGVASPPATETLKATTEDFAGSLGPGPGSKPTPEMGSKPSPEVGAFCGCPSIKNYPEQVVELPGRRRRRCKQADFTPGAWEALK